jgi:hypothetical protein
MRLRLRMLGEASKTKYIPFSASWADIEVGGQFSGEMSGRDLLASAGILA